MGREQEIWVLNIKFISQTYMYHNTSLLFIALYYYEKLVDNPLTTLLTYNAKGIIYNTLP